MQIFGLQLTRRVPVVEAVPVEEQKEVPRGPGTLSPAGSTWWPWSWLRESFAGAWQRNIETPVADVLTYGTVFACITLIASDIAKMGLRLVQRDSDGIWNVVFNSAYSSVLRRPNHYQNRIMFIMQWVISKLVCGNTYILKERDGSQRVRKMYILDPARVTVLVAADGSVFYALTGDVLAGIEEGIPAVPASEIIHDVMYPLYHPLVGLSPIHACGLAAMQGLRIQANSAKFFEKGSNPGGVLTAPGAISNETAQRLKVYWEEKYAGSENVGKIAVLGDGLKFEPMGMKALDAQLVQQLQWTSENICSTFHVPGYKVGVGSQPNQSNIEALDQAYYSQCLQILIECIEALLDEGLAIADPQGTEFDLDDLLRMDTSTMMEVQVAGVGGGLVAPNEGRKKLNLKPVKGGETPYLQQQNYSLAALDARDRMGPAPSSTTPAPAPAPALPAPAKGFDLDVDEVQLALLSMRLDQDFSSAVAGMLDA